MFEGRRTVRAARRCPPAAAALAIGGVFLASMAAAFSAIPGRAADSPAPAAPRRGAVLFEQHCLVCHSKPQGDTTPFGPPNLHGVLSKNALSAAEARRIIVAGRASMPAWGRVLSPAQIDDLIAFLRTY
jgi:mono/diheme cytochrome c family protein